MFLLKTQLLTIKDRRAEAVGAETSSRRSSIFGNQTSTYKFEPNVNGVCNYSILHIASVT